MYFEERSFKLKSGRVKSGADLTWSYAAKTKSWIGSA
jgi:hypothetical protein